MGPVALIFGGVAALASQLRILGHSTWVDQGPSEAARHACPGEVEELVAKRRIMRVIIEAYICPSFGMAVNQIMAKTILFHVLAVILSRSLNGRQLLITTLNRFDRLSNPGLEDLVMDLDLPHLLLDVVVVFGISISFRFSRILNRCGLESNHIFLLRWPAQN